MRRRATCCRRAWCGGLESAAQRPCGARRDSQDAAKPASRAGASQTQVTRVVRCDVYALSQWRYHNGVITMAPRVDPAGGAESPTHAIPVGARISAFRIAIRERTARVPAYPRPRRRAIGDPPRAEPAPTPRSGPRNPPARRTTAGRKFAIRSRRVHASFYFVYNGQKTGRVPHSRTASTTHKQTRITLIHDDTTHSLSSASACSGRSISTGLSSNDTRE